MNMRLHVNKKLAEIFFLILLLLCMHAEAHHEREFEHQETVENQKRIMATTRELEDTNSHADRSNVMAAPIIETDNTTTKAGKDNAFWPGVIYSLNAIFFVEFGDRVTATF